MINEKERTYEEKQETNPIYLAIPLPVSNIYYDLIMNYYNMILDNSITIVTQSMRLRGGDTSC